MWSTSSPFIAVGGLVNGELVNGELVDGELVDGGRWTSWTNWTLWTWTEWTGNFLRSTRSMSTESSYSPHGPLSTVVLRCRRVLSVLDARAPKLDAELEDAVLFDLVAPGTAELDLLVVDRGPAPALAAFGVVEQQLLVRV